MAALTGPPRPVEGTRLGTTHVSFACQRCNQPLKLDHSFNTLDKTLIGELTSPLTQEDEVNLIPTQTQDGATYDSDEADEVSRRYIKPSRLASIESGNDFTLLGDIDPNTTENLSHRLKVMSYLFDVMSGQSEVDHPLCEECTDNLLEQLDQQLIIAEEECKDYRDFLDKLSSESENVQEKDLEADLQKLVVEEEGLQQQLASIEAEHQLLQEQTKLEKLESKRLNVEEDNYWKEYNDYKRQLLDLEDNQKSVDNQLRYAQAQVDKLKKTNAFNATFHIWHSGHFGTINNFRLGRLPNVPVEWHEINAAWGQTVLLLHSLAKKMNLTFERFRLVPYGSHSFLESLSDKSKELPLYGSGGIRFFWDTKFDHAMVAFLDCLQQFKEEVEKGDSGFCLPYKMEKGRIEDPSSGTSYSIKVQFNSEEEWTKALKFMLTNLKWGLAWVSSQFANTA